MEVMRSVRADQRRRLSTFIDSLVNDPFQAGDYTESDDTLREIQIKIIGHYAVAFWTDHAATEVKITNIARAD
jgi:hypothetical protein